MSSEAISFDQEEVLWEKGILGEDNPELLQNTLVYLLGISFALRGGDEHWRLRCLKFDPQINVMVDEKGVKFLSFTEDLKMKTNQGGCLGRLSNRDISKFMGILRTPTAT